jgi:L-fuconolactonase
VTVDAHQHLWRADYAWLQDVGLDRIRRDYTATDLRAVIDGTGVSATVLVEAGRCDLAETAEFLDLADTTPEIAGVVGWAPLVDPDPARTLAELRDLPGGGMLVGVRDQVQAVTDPGFLDRIDVRRSFTAAGDAGLVVDLVVRADQVTACARAVAATPATAFVLDHLGKPNRQGFAAWRQALAALATNPNAVAKLSGLVTEVGPQWTVGDLRPYVETALDQFGPERLMYGSDWPVCELVATYADVLAATVELIGQLSADEQRAVMSGTARRVYGLGTA